MEKVIIIGYTAKSEGLILETNIHARLKQNRIPSKETFVSWDKIGNLVFENYAELESVDIIDSIRNKTSEKKEFKQQILNIELGQKCIQNYENRKVNCVVTKVDNHTFNATILGLGIEMVDIPNEKFNPKLEEEDKYCKDTMRTTYKVSFLKDDEWQVADESGNVLNQGSLSNCESFINLKKRGVL